LRVQAAPARLWYATERLARPVLLAGPTDMAELGCMLIVTLVGGRLIYVRHVGRSRTEPPDRISVGLGLALLVVLVGLVVGAYTT
jgi:hypothetical protein